MTLDAMAIQQPCSGCTSQSERPDALGVSSVSLSAHAGLFEALVSGLEEEQVELARADVPVSRLLATPGVVTQVHSVPGGGVLVTAATSTGPQAVIKEVGLIVSMYHAFALRFSMEPDVRAVTVHLNIQQPIQLDYTWHFAFRDVIELPDGRFMASSVELDPLKMRDAPRLDNSAAGCAAKCGATGITGILLGCLASFFIGPPGYLACCVASVGMQSSRAWYVSRDVTWASQYMFTK